MKNKTIYDIRSTKLDIEIVPLKNEPAKAFTGERNSSFVNISGINTDAIKNTTDNVAAITWFSTKLEANIPNETNTNINNVNPKNETKNVFKSGLPKYFKIKA